MPFPQRTVEPRRVSRLPARGKAKRAVPFTSLDEVGCHTLTNIIHQLADLSQLAADVFLGIELEAAGVFRRSSRVQGRLRTLQVRVGVLDPKKVKIPVSNLDEESKWTVHYTAPWHQQENVFLPGSRPPCVEDLHRQAKVNLKSALRECDKLRKDGFRSSQYYSQGPIFSDTTRSTGSLHDDDDDDDDDKKSLASSAEDDQSQLSTRSQTPSEKADDTDAPPKTPTLPTPEEKMRQTALAVPTDIVAINVTGAVFDRQASIRRSLVNTDTVSRRSKKVKRRKTISGLPDDIDLELAAKGRGGELRPHSMFIPGQYSTLGRVGSVNSALRRSRTRDSSCQTEDVKVVQPSVRKIRAKRGQGIAAQIAGISTSSSTGSLSVCGGDSSGVPTLPRQHNGDRARFNSLPRQGARVSLSADPIYSSTPIKSEDRGVPRRQIGKLQADDTAVHMRNIPRTGTLPRPRSQEVQRTRSNEWGGGPARVVLPHAAYSTSFIPNATLSGSSEVITLGASGQPSHSPTVRTSGPAIFTHSSTCPALATSTPARVPIEGSRSDDGSHSHSTLPTTPPSCQTDERWIYDTPENLVVPHRSLTSSSSTPINQLYSSLEASSRTTTDSSSLYSQDNDGYFTSMHLDSGLRSRGQGGGHGPATRHSMYECREMAAGQDEYGSLYSDRSLSRSISLRKCKKPPPPPTRTDSLRRKPGPKKPLGGVCAIGESNAGTLNESLIATLQQSLQLGLRPGKGAGASPSSPSHSPSSDYEDPWVLRPRSQSSVSAGSSATSLTASANGVSNAYSLCPVTPAHSDTSSLRSDYADSWGYYVEYPRNHGDQSAQTPAAHIADGTTAGPRQGERHNGNDGVSRAPGTEIQTEEVAVKGKTSSPERVHRLTSPSSGYSSQSNTPTAGTPVPSGIRAMSPSGNRPRPRVPERKSSLLSSLSGSSSSTSLSSNTSDSLKSAGPPAPPPLPLTSSSTPTTPLSPPPPFPSSAPADMNVDPLLQNMAQTLSPPPGCSTSPEFPPPPSPETLFRPSVSLNGSFSPPPPVSLKVPPPPPPLPAATSISSSKFPVMSAPKNAVPNSPTKSPMLLITPFALQSVRLRSVRRTEESELYFDSPEHQPQDEKTKDSSPSPVSKLLEELSLECGIANDTPDFPLVNGMLEKQSCLSNGIEALPRDAGSPVKQKPPVIAKKPKFSFILPLSPLPVQEVILSPCEDVDAAPQEPEKSEEEIQEESSEASAEIQDDSQASTGSDGEPFQNGDDDGTSSTAGSVSSKEDDAGDVFDSNGEESSPALSLDGTAETGSAAAPTPTTARTTEDLFAAIHRSKREVLGRKKSDEDKPRSGIRSMSPPVTPPCGSPSSSSRPSGSIQRQLRKSSTSSDTFKALLLKKGSRSESGFRMSAAEMLRSTDPRSQRSRSEPAPADPPSPPRSPRASPARGKRASDERNRYEAPVLSPPASSAFKYGRSRTPPSAASSKYNARCRLLSSPMTVICERDGEYADANGTLADDGAS
ncbi:NHS-like protein 1 isoform X2 [Corythoichthys intestinalis]|uniref:NHS-like protein 1 isoform X2 n=1 Tax=Corythoichthys intestinalis TaxID=161448 RepID=UPI0025A56373|nr:NHS-like protein 1 isoform X2 [Corythoichthys intestinalis]